MFNNVCDGRLAFIMFYKFHPKRSEVAETMCGPPSNQATGDSLLFNTEHWQTLTKWILTATLSTAKYCKSFGNLAKHCNIFKLNYLGN